MTGTKIVSGDISFMSLNLRFLSVGLWRKGCIRRSLSSVTLLLQSGHQLIWAGALFPPSSVLLPCFRPASAPPASPTAASWRPWSIPFRWRAQWSMIWARQPWRLLLPSGSFGSGKSWLKEASLSRSAAAPIHSLVWCGSSGRWFLGFCFSLEVRRSCGFEILGWIVLVLG